MRTDSHHSEPFPASADPARGVGDSGVPAAVAGLHTSGMTSRLILDYVEREGGRAAVESLLADARLEGLENRLRDEDAWFSYETKIALLEGATRVLDDALAARHVGSASLDLGAGAALKLAVRAFGGPRAVYANIVAGGARLTRAHHLEIEHLADTRARLRYRDVSGVGYRRVDCEYTIGLLTCVPALFGMPAARVRHHRCAVDGADACVYEVRWRARHSTRRTLGAWAAGSAAATALTAQVAPRALPAVAAVSGVGAGALGGHAWWSLRRRTRSLDAWLREQTEVNDRLTESLSDLVSDFRLDEVLDKITRNARATVAGHEFVLLLSDDPGLSSRSDGVSAESAAAIERWAGGSAEAFERPLRLDDLSSEPALASLPSGRAPLASLCSAPLHFRDQRLGVLVALAPVAGGFLPRDPALLESFAAQAAIAVAHGRTLGRLEELARQDPLTRLLNHREFHEALALELERCRRYGLRSAVILFDVDRLKLVNDRHGHAFGDRVLHGVADALREASRANDVVCRIGGDEFGVVLPESSAVDALAVGERAAAAVLALDLGVSLSFGIAEWPEHGADKDELLLYADHSLYAAKPARRELAE